MLFHILCMLRHELRKTELCQKFTPSSVSKMETAQACTYPLQLSKEKLHDTEVNTSKLKTTGEHGDLKN